MMPVTLYGTQGAPLTDYTNGAQVTSSGPVTYSGFLIAAFNQTGISLSSPNGAIALGANKVSGSVAYLIPVPACNPSPSTNTKTTNPSICENVAVTVQETIAATGKHIGAYFLFVSDTQAAYIESYFTTPALTSWPDADNDAGIETGFGGILLPSSANGPTVLIEQSVGAIMTY